MARMVFGNWVSESLTSRSRHDRPVHARGESRDGTLYTLCGRPISARMRATRAQSLFGGPVGERQIDCNACRARLALPPQRGR